MTEDRREGEPGDKPEPKDSGSIQFRGEDGEWHELVVERKRTGDPELDAIWAMSFGELQRILEDESHPLHEKARQVSREITKPIVEAANEIMRPISESMMKSIDTAAIGKAVVPKIDMSGLLPAQSTSWFAKLFGDVPKFELPTGLANRPSVNFQTPPPPPALTVPRQRWIDLDTEEPPDASLADIQEAAEARAHEMRGRQVELLSEMLAEARASVESGEEALAISRQALDATKSSKRAGWTAAWAAIGAAVIGVGGIVVTLINAR